MPLREAVLLSVVLAAALTARAWRIADVGLNHFDEGVYALSALGISDSAQPARLFAEQVKFSPPVYFGMTGLAFRAAGPSDLVPIALNVLLGTLTVLVVWLVVRAWFGPETAIAAATLLALDEYHIAFSRTALTDIAFGLALVVALGLLWRAVSRSSLAWTCLAGVAVGIAWNVKYHGWFALLIAAPAAVPVAWFARWPAATVRRTVFLLSLAGLVAAACYLPWAWFIGTQPGGYAALAEYQRTMLDPHWFRNLRVYAGRLEFFEGPLSHAALPVAILVAGLVNRDLFRQSWRTFTLLATVAVGVLIAGSTATTVMLTAAVIPSLLRRRREHAAWILLVWLILWFLSAPVYEPYARLLLPFVIATQIAAASALVAFLSPPSARAAGPEWLPAAAAIGLTAALAGIAARTDAGGPWRPSRSMAEAASAMQASIPPGARVVVIGEPPIAFYLQVAGRRAFDQVETVEELTDAAPAYVVTGVYAKRAPQLREGLDRHRSNLRVLGTFEVRPSDVRLLDDFEASGARAYLDHPDDTFDLTLFEWVPDAPPLS